MITPGQADDARQAMDISHDVKLTALDVVVTRVLDDNGIVDAALWVERKDVSHHKAFDNRATGAAKFYRVKITGP